MLICILSIPTILIIRLIMYRKARKQLREFIQLTKNRLKSLPGLIINHRGESYSWSPDDTGTEVPYFAADDSEGVPSSVEQSENSDSD